MQKIDDDAGLGCVLFFGILFFGIGIIGLFGWYGALGIGTVLLLLAGWLLVM